MSSSLRFWAGGDICGSFRRPSRYLMSCQWVKNTGCPASEGVPGTVALPSRPWQAAHGSALRRPASTSAAAAGAVTRMTSVNAKPAMPGVPSHRRNLALRDLPWSRFSEVKLVTSWRFAAARAPASPAHVPSLKGGSGRGPRRPPPSMLPLVGNPVDRSRVVVGDQERAVLHLLRVHGPAPDLVALEPSLGKRLVLGHVTRPKRDHHHPEADLLCPVPGAALGEEGAVLVLGGEHRARVELHAVAGHVRARLDERRRELAAGAPLAELGVGDVALVAVREAEVQTLLRCDVEAVARHVLAQPIAGVGCEVELLRHRMPVEAHAVPHAVGEVLEAGAVGIDARDVGVGVGRDADVAGRADVEVELAVRPEGQVLPAMRHVAGQDVVDHFHGRRIVQLALDARHLGDPRDLGDVERPVLEGYAIGQVEALGDDLDLALPALVHDRVDVAGDAAAHEERALVAPGHGARVVDPARPHRDLEAGWDLDLVDLELTERRGCRRLGDGRQHRVRHAGGLTLLPGWRRLLG